MDEASKAVEAAARRSPPSAPSSNSRATRSCGRCRTRRSAIRSPRTLSDNLTVGYNTSEVIMARLMQTTSAKERVYQQSVSFFSTNESVLTALSASFTGMHGLHESTQTLEQDEGRRQPEPRDALRDRRQGPGGGAEGRLRPDDPRRLGQEARRLRRQLPAALVRDHRRNAQTQHQERRTRFAMRSRRANGAWRDWCKRAPSWSRRRAKFAWSKRPRRRAGASPAR